MKTTASITAIAIVLSTPVFAQQPSKQDFVAAVEKYHYSTLSMNKVAQVGCSKFVVGFPAGFSMSTVQAELLANSPQGAINKIKSFFTDPRYEAAIHDQLSWMDTYKSRKTSNEFQSMCADFGGKQLMEWQQYRKDFFRIAAFFK